MCLGTNINFFFFLLHHTAYGLLVSLPRIEPGPPAAKVPSPEFSGLPKNSPNINLGAN